MSEKKRRDNLHANYNMLEYAKKQKEQAIQDGDDILKNQMTKDIEIIEQRIKEMGGEI